MARKSVQEDLTGSFAICITHSDGEMGWITNEEAKVKTFKTSEDGEKFLAKLKRTNHYSFNCKAEVLEFKGF